MTACKSKTSGLDFESDLALYAPLYKDTKVVQRLDIKNISILRIKRN